MYTTTVEDELMTRGQDAHREEDSALPLSDPGQKSHRKAEQASHGREKENETGVNDGPDWGQTRLEKRDDGPDGTVFDLTMQGDGFYDVYVAWKLPFRAGFGLTGPLLFCRSQTLHP